MKDKMILGSNVCYTTDCGVTGVNNNVIVVAGSGSGKTMSITEPRLLETYDSNLIVTVTKRRIADKYTPMFRERGYNVIDLNFIEPDKSTVAFDPMEYVSSYSDMKFLAESIVMSDPRKSRATHIDPYWDETAKSLLCAEIGYTLMTGDDPSFADVLELNDRLRIKEDGGSITTTLDDEFELINRKAPGCFAVSCWRTFRDLPIKTASCIYSSLNTALDKIFSPEIRKMIGKRPRLNFGDIADKKTVLFVSTSAVNPALNTFVNLFYAQMFQRLFEYAESLPNGKLPIPVSVLCDDFATGSRIQNFPEYISVLREKDISVTLLVQSESQLESMYGTDDAVTIINNCGSYVFMGGMDLRTAHNISQRVNLPLEDVLYMPVGQEIVFRQGQKPVITQRYDILNDKEYQRVTRAYERKLKAAMAKERR